MITLKRLYKPLCRAPIYRALAYLGRSAIEYYENRNYDMSSNGELRLLRKLAPFQPRVVFDVGANIGEWSQIATRLFPSAKLYAFEPAPETFLQLQRNLADEPRTEVFQQGLSEREEVVQFRFYPGHTSQASRYEFTVREEPQLIDVQLVQGDRFCQERGIDHIDLLKVDTEGADLDVLRGFDGMLSRGQVDVVQFEYGRINIKSRALLCDFYDYLLARGFRIGKLFPRRVEFRPYTLRHENFIGPNFVAVREARPDIIAAVGVTLEKAPKL